MTTIQERKEKRVAAELLHYKMFQQLRQLIDDICNEKQWLLPFYIRCKKQRSTRYLDLEKVEEELENIESGKPEVERNADIRRNNPTTKLPHGNINFK
jgi:hypothetical protein